MKTFLWYDLETFGLNSHYDRIAQAAAIRTDMELNIIERPTLLYCRLSPDYLPNPQSCLVTGITPQKVNKDGLCEAEFIDRLYRILTVPDTIAVGYNSIAFDDECIRSALYRNLYDPYEREYRNGCSRWDIINLVRATRDLRPEGIVWDTKNPETNATSFRLTDLTAENGINQEGAHDALVDVYATIEVAKMIKRKQPKLFQWALSNRGKLDVARQINAPSHVPFLHTSASFVSERGNTHPLIPLFYEAERSTNLYCFDLTFDIPESPTLDYRTSGIYRLSTNRCPFIAPLGVLDESAEKRLGFTKEEVLAKARLVASSAAFSRDALLKDRTEAEQKETDPDLTLYQGFPSQHDKNMLQRIRAMKAADRIGKGEHLFENDKYHKLLWRQVARNWPEVLSNEDGRKWKNFCAYRLITPPVEGALSYELYMRSIQEKLESLDTTGEEKLILKDLLAYGEELNRTIIRG